MRNAVKYMKVNEGTVLNYERTSLATMEARRNVDSGVRELRVFIILDNQGDWNSRANSGVSVLEFRVRAFLKGQE